MNLSSVIGKGECIKRTYKMDNWKMRKRVTNQLSNG